MEIYKVVPNEMLSVIYKDGNLTSRNPISDDDFIKYGRRISKLYQLAVRWETVIKKWLPHFKEKQKRDVRGFYYLYKEKNLDQKLKNFSSLSDAEQKAFASHLHKLCLNNDIKSKKCKKNFNKSRKRNDLVNLKNKYWNKAVKNWNSFWQISKPRKDVVWKSSAPGVMKVSFKDPKNERISNWLKENIEDEFKTDTWQLEFNLKDRGPGIAHLKFESGVTPHVSDGNIIVMDSNATIEEYSVKWTIRHEYAHILRLPDCYFEFYDAEEGVAVNYQLDVTDLMCSRAGNFNKRIYDELKRAYYKK